jgi:hypothetical protein
MNDTELSPNQPPSASRHGLEGRRASLRGRRDQGYNCSQAARRGIMSKPFHHIHGPEWRHGIAQLTELLSNFAGTIQLWIGVRSLFHAENTQGGSERVRLAAPRRR